jgi:hypothetical protein
VNFLKVFWGCSEMVSQISRFEFKLHVETSLISLYLAHVKLDYLEQLQQFGKPTWHPYNFGKTRKIGLQQFGKPTWQK